MNAPDDKTVIGAIVEALLDPNKIFSDTDALKKLTDHCWEIFCKNKMAELEVREILLFVSRNEEVPHKHTLELLLHLAGMEIGLRELRDEWAEEKKAEAQNN